jgi:hypothetical protein
MKDRNLVEHAAKVGHYFLNSPAPNWRIPRYAQRPGSRADVGLRPADDRAADEVCSSYTSKAFGPQVRQQVDPLPAGADFLGTGRGRRYLLHQEHTKLRNKVHVTDVVDGALYELDADTNVIHYPYAKLVLDKQ